MQLLPILIAIVLGAAALAFVLYPFYEHKVVSRDGARSSQSMPVLSRGEHTRETDMQISNLPDTAQAEREQAARSALQEVELDYQLGNISETDYAVLRERYVRRALVALKSRYEQEQKLDGAIEAKLQKMREHDDDAK